MRNTWTVFLAVFLLLAVCSCSQAAYGLTWGSTVTVLVEDNQHKLLGSHGYAWDGSIPSSELTDGPLAITFSLTPEPLWGQSLFSKIGLLANTGSTIWVSSDKDDSFYSTMVSRLTDGQSGRLYGFFTVKSGSSQVDGGEVSYTESSFLGGYPADFSGKTIGRIGLRIDDTNTRDRTSVVPEPIGAIPLVFGVFGMCGLAFRKRAAAGRVQGT